MCPLTCLYFTSSPVNSLIPPCHCAVLEWILSRKGVVTTDMLDDPRDKGKGAKADGVGAGAGRGFTKRYGFGDDDDDDD
jgi:hypothetical protein